jgi:hypothetical protein
MIFLLATAAAMLVSVQGARASTEAKKAYAARVEPICKSTTPAVEGLLSGTRKMAYKGRPVTAGRRFIHASNLFAGTVRKVARVHRPGPYTAQLGEWLERLRNVKESMRRLGKALKQRDRVEALNRAVQLREAGTLANQAVAGFHLHHCRIYASRFN